MDSSKLHIGTSGWSYAHWARGRFYPKGMKATDYLAFYATHFDTVEVNTSFYHLPRETLIDGWRERAPETFTFTMKMWRRVTHLKKLRDTREDLELFGQRLMRFKPTQLGAVLIQLPPSYPCDPDRLDQFLADLRAVSGADSWRIAFEFRNSSWYGSDTNAILNQYGAALCLHDHSAAPIDEPNEAPLIYLRRHGGIGNYQGPYTQEQLKADVKRIRQWLKQGKEVFVYYDNDVEGYAIDNALELKRMLEK